MSETPVNPDIDVIPTAVAEPKRKHSLQLVWIIPIVAALIGGVLAVKTYLQKGPTITIEFKTGDGLEAGKTKIKYKEVEIGEVTSIAINKDLKSVVATAELKKAVTPYLVEDTKFWVVRPRISGGTITGLSTLMGGSYIGIDIGTSQKAQSHFRGLDTPPVVTADVPGSRFKLHSADLSSLDIGSPLYFRRIQVGQILSYELDKDGKGVTFTIFVASPYDGYVVQNTRFWNASGVDLTLDAGGLKLDTQSLSSIMIGGIAFQTPESTDSRPVSANTVFTLFPSRDEAMKNPDSVFETYVLTFKESVRGLSTGAQVDFRGLPVGEVSRISAEFDHVTKQINMLVEVKIFPERWQIKMLKTSIGSDHRSRINAMVGGGLRAQLKSGNLLTGQLYIALDYFPNATKASVDWKANPPQFPTTPGSLMELQAALDRVFKKIEKLPLDEVVAEVRQTIVSLDTTLKSADRLVKRVDGEVVPEIKTVLEEARKTLSNAKQTLSADAPLQTDLRETLRELSKAAHSLRVLTDYLDRNPEALLRGKQEESP